MTRRPQYPQASTPMLDSRGQPIEPWRRYLERIGVIDKRVAGNVPATGTADEKVNAVLAALKAAGLMEAD